MRVTRGGVKCVDVNDTQMKIQNTRCSRSHHLQILGEVARAEATFN